MTGDVWLTVEFDGTDYKVSIDDGATFTTVPTGGLANQAVTDSRSGKVLYVDTTGINQTGVELVHVPGTYDAFNALISIRDILKNDRNLSEDLIKQFRDSSSDSLDELKNLLLQKEVTIGSRSAFLSDLQSNLQNLKNNAQDEADQLQQADIAQVSIDLARHQALYQMSLSVAGKLMSLSLLDFLE